MPYRYPIRTGDRVALAPHTDQWAQGQRFGVVEAVNYRMRQCHVRLDGQSDCTALPFTALLGAVV